MSFHIISMIAIPLIYSVYAGLADALKDGALAAASKKASDPGVIAAAGAIETAHVGVSLMNERMLRLARDGEPGPETTAEAMALRTLLARFALEIGDRTMELASGSAFYRARGLELKFRDLQAARYHPLQPREQAMLSGRMALGLGPDA